MSKSYLPVLIWKLDVYWRIWYTKQLEDLQVPNLIVRRTVLRSTVNSGFQIIKASFTIFCQTVINILKFQIFLITRTLTVKQFVTISIFFNSQFLKIFVFNASFAITIIIFCLVYVPFTFATLIVNARIKVFFLSFLWVLLIFWFIHELWWVSEFDFKMY